MHKDWVTWINHAVEPPSTVMIAPVIRSDFSSKRCKTVAATCSVLGNPNGALRLIDSNFLPWRLRVISVSMNPGATQFTVMEGAHKIAQLAIRTCGGQSMLKSLPLERIFRDSRCGSLMLPWTAEICLDRLGKVSLYKPGEKD